MENANRVRIARLITLHGFNSARSFLALKQSDEIDWNSYVEGDMTFMGYNIENGVVPALPATHASKLVKIGGDLGGDISAVRYSG